VAKPAVVDASILAAAGATITPTALVVDSADVSYEALEDLCAFLGNLHRGCEWWIGDALLQVEMRYGDKVTQAAEATGLAPQTIINRMSICSRIPRSKRKQGMAFSTHAVVAYMEPARRDELLALGEKEGWKRKHMIAAKKGEDDLPPEVHCECPTCGRLHTPPGS
jgi:hypothetical protein